jgi:PPP family 3-phenylpropionic acid transporter
VSNNSPARESNASQTDEPASHHVDPRRASLTLSLLWAFGLGGLGFILPFYTLYLTENAGLSGTEAGIVVGLLPLMGMVMQPIWGQIGDRTGRRNRVVATICFGASLFYALLARQESFLGFAATTALLAVFLTSFGSMTMSASIAALDEDGSHRLGRVRVWGTLAYGLVVVTFPLCLAALTGVGITPGIANPGSSEPVLGWMFVGASAFAAVGGVAALAIPRTHATRVRAHAGEWLQLLREPNLLRALTFGFLAYMSMQGPMHMFPILVRSHGGEVDAIAHMWIWMIALEIPLVFVLGRSVELLGKRGIVAIGIGASAIRWLVSGLTGDMTVLTAVQILHGVTVWGVMMGMPVYIDALVPNRLRSTGQAAFGFVGAGLGAVASNFTSGWLVDVGGAGAPAIAGGALGLAALLLVPLLLPRPPSRRGG